MLDQQDHAVDGSDDNAGNTKGHGVGRVPSETGDSSDDGGGGPGSVSPSDSEDDTDQIAVSKS